MHGKAFSLPKIHRNEGEQTENKTERNNRGKPREKKTTEQFTLFQNMTCTDLTVGELHDLDLEV